MKLALVVLALAACSGDEPACDPAGAFCAHLSSYGLFDDLAAQVPAAGVVPYQIATPLFSDYTTKDRYFYLPPGTQMTWRDDVAFDLPPGAMLIKTFSYLTDRRTPELGRRHVETRLLVRDATGWRGAAYTYGDDGRDATLAIAGATVPSTWIHDDGTVRTNDYFVPNKNQCKNCHAETDDVISLLGPKARHLNRGTQLQDLIDRGVLAGAPPPAQWPKVPETLDERARAWLDISCAHCHNPRGAARTSGLFLDVAETDPATFGVCKPPVAAGRGSGGRAFGIVPGQPDASIMMLRIESTEAEVKMPELGRNLVDDDGAALIRAWIAAMPGSCP